jgi:hypothetical protein
MLSKNEMHTTFMEMAPHFLTFLDGEKKKIESEVARLKATEAQEAQQEIVIPDDPDSATAVAESGEPTQAIDGAETAENSAQGSEEIGIKPRRAVSGIRRRTT